jgi:hypothetical protein
MTATSELTTLPVALPNHQSPQHKTLRWTTDELLIVITLYRGDAAVKLYHLLSLQYIRFLLLKTSEEEKEQSAEASFF